jgi:hypothetical protein
MLNSIQRTKLFNCTFKVWKWRDYKSSQEYSCSPKLFEVHVSNVFSSDDFYIQKENDLESINQLTECMQRYTNVLLCEDEMMHTELYNYMLHTTKFDLVLAKSNLDHKWKRAIVLDKYDGNEFFDSCSSLNGKNLNSIGYFNVLFIDYGVEELIEYRKVLESFEERLLELIVILPTNTKLNQFAPYSLKCSLNRTDIKKKILLNKNYLLWENDFEVRFRDMFNKIKNNKELRDYKLLMKIVQVENIKNKTEAVIELFKIDVKNNKCNIIDLINNQIMLYQCENENEKVMFCERVFFFFLLSVCMFCVCVCW